jgi:hypothetical protein
MMHKIFGSDKQAQALRAVLRAAIVCATAFGLKLTADQVAAIQLAAEAILSAARTWYE